MFDMEYDRLETSGLIEERYQTLIFLAEAIDHAVLQLFYLEALRKELEQRKPDLLSENIELKSDVDAKKEILQCFAESLDIKGLLVDQKRHRMRGDGTKGLRIFAGLEKEKIKSLLEDKL